MPNKISREIFKISLDKIVVSKISFGDVDIGTIYSLKDKDSENFYIKIAQCQCDKLKFNTVNLNTGELFNCYKAAYVFPITRNLIITPSY